MKLCLTSVSCFIRVTLHKMCLKCVVGSTELISGQSYKQFTLVIYNSIVIIWGIFKSGTTLESKITIVVLYKIGHRSLTVSFYAKLQLLQFFYLIYSSSTVVTIFSLFPCYVSSNPALDTSKQPLLSLFSFLSSICDLSCFARKTSN